MNVFKSVRVKSKRYCEQCGEEMERMSGGSWGCNNPNCIVWSARLDHFGKFVSVKYAAVGLGMTYTGVKEAIAVEG